MERMHAPHRQRSIGWRSSVAVALTEVRVVSSVCCRSGERERNKSASESCCIGFYLLMMDRPAVRARANGGEFLSRLLPNDGGCRLGLLHVTAKVVPDKVNCGIFPRVHRMPIGKRMAIRK